ncbi:MAG: hypothetical protein CME36_02645 [unclassified Hahellaceae]|nr:hypothetical protein [Hahellaceae bacterium]|tara:strand:+ start:2563 stop:2844 length:282 start_codon:yes stop_codon:yes gene_type:complete
MSHDIYRTFIGAKGVALTWIGSAIGPVFFVIGLEPEYRRHLAVGIVCFIFVIVSIADGLKALKAGSWAGVVVYSVVPFALVVIGGVLVVTSLE